MKQMLLQKISKFILDLFVKLGPVILTLYLVFFKLNIEKSQYLYFGLILGFSLSIWASLWWIDHKINLFHDSISKTKHIKIRVLDSTEIVPTVAWLYRIAKAKFYSTHIGYRAIDKNKSNPNSNDLTKDIYKSKSSISFQRIIQIVDKGDREWVKEMIQDSKNDNYFIKILDEPVSNLPYPNFIIAERFDGDSQLFMSFRGSPADGSGSFAFITSNTDIINGIKSHFERFFNALPTANECIKKWGIL